MIRFETTAGNSYAWIDDIGIFLPTNPISNAILDELTNSSHESKESIIKKLDTKFNRDEIEYYYNQINKYDSLRYLLKERTNEGLNRFYEEPILKKSILRDGITSLILNVTEDCNFRCNYCIFSGEYKYYRRHSRKYMDFSIAKKAIDYYFSLIIEGKKYNPLRRPTVSFYGGEPLLNFRLIKQCVEYIDREYANENTNYNFTTNGSMIDKEKIRWLIEHDFLVLISLCGPKEEHDRLRVYKDGKGTYEDIMNNIIFMNKSEYNNVGVIVVFDLKTDLFKLEEFFNRQDAPNLFSVDMVSDLEGCDYFKQFSEVDKITFEKRSALAIKYYVDNVNNTKDGSFFDFLFGKSFISAINDPGSIVFGDPIITYSGACIPGKKLFVDVDGIFHMCEKINNKYPIGNAENGLDFERINEILQRYFQHLDKCITCNTTRMCRRCYANLSAGDEFMYTSDNCIYEEDNVRNLLTNAFSFAEMNPKIVEKSVWRRD